MVGPGRERSGAAGESPADPGHLIIGRITRPHGVAGEVRVEIRTDLPERLRWLNHVLVGVDALTLMAVESVRFHQKVAILKLGGCDTRDQADALRGQWLWVPMDEAIPLAEDELFLYQLVGLRVETEEGQVLGVVEEVLETGANDVILVRTSSGELLLPDIPGVVLEVDPEAGRMLVRVPSGLGDD